ncbi:MAG: ribonuclease III [Pseudomonadota bacterium]
MTKKRGQSRKGARPRPAPGARDEDLEARLGHSFADRTLLERALTHPSAVRGGVEATYQRLEFLGDRVLGLVVADALLKAYPQAPEGELAKRHTQMVRAETCAEIAQTLDIGPHMRVAAPERRGGPQAIKATILADAMEALIGAVHQDAGFEAAQGFVLAHWPDGMEGEGRLTDAKSMLQEWALSRGDAIPTYREVSREGPDHAPVFTIEAAVEDAAPAEGSGSSKRDAEQAAAQALLKREGLWRRGETEKRKR